MWCVIQVDRSPVSTPVLTLRFDYDLRRDSLLHSEFSVPYLRTPSPSWSEHRRGPPDLLVSDYPAPTHLRPLHLLVFSHSNLSSLFTGNSVCPSRTYSCTSLDYDLLDCHLSTTGPLHTVSPETRCVNVPLTRGTSGITLRLHSTTPWFSLAPSSWNVSLLTSVVAFTARHGFHRKPGVHSHLPRIRGSSLEPSTGSLARTAISAETRCPIPRLAGRGPFPLFSLRPCPSNTPVSPIASVRTTSPRPTAVRPFRRSRVRRRHRQFNYRGSPTRT